ncbi:hypothetical protein [Aureispira anguillae]|uniref:Uncharacterized protein n=1 Tax=Aureispira anguillae TaxID=2864201 RepID=A0A915YEG2_9BACT|nr:hypothetical protein [Aureispira anguillae]BDS11554.1 hypothetical protein AsAng_0022680 [Aureispira anguillae]
MENIILDETLEKREKEMKRTSKLKIVEILIWGGSLFFIAKVILFMQNPSLSLTFEARLVIAFVIVLWFLMPTFYVIWRRYKVVKQEEQGQTFYKGKSKLGVFLFWSGLISIISWFFAFGAPSLENYSSLGYYNDLFNLLSTLGMMVLYLYFFYKTAPLLDLRN